MDREAASRLRKAINDLREERHHIEEALLESREVLRGSLIAHTSLRGGGRRRRPAFYLYRTDSGRRRMVYLKKDILAKAREQVNAYRRYQEGLRRLRQIGAEILAKLKELRESQDALESR